MGEGAVGVLFLEGGTGASLEIVRDGGVGLFVLVLGLLMVDGAVLGVWGDGGEAFGALFLGEGTKSSLEVRWNGDVGFGIVCGVVCWGLRVIMGWFFAWVKSSEEKAWLFAGFLEVLKCGVVELYLVVLGVVMGGGIMLGVWSGDGIGLGFC